MVVDQAAEVFLREVRRTEPERVVLLIGVAGADHRVHGFLDVAVRVERAFEVVVIKGNAEGPEVFVLFVAQIGDGVLADEGAVIQIAVRGDRFAGARHRALRDVVLRDIGDVFAVVAVFRERDLLAEEFLAAERDGDGQIVDLSAGVVVVVLTRDRPALSGEDLREHVAERALAGVAEMQRAGRVGGHVLHDDGLAGLRLIGAERVALTENSLHDFLLSRLGKAQIDEARPGDFRGGEQGAEFRIRLHDGHELLGDLAGSLMKNLGGLQSDRTGNIAVFGEFRALQRNGREPAPIAVRARVKRPIRACFC